MRFLIIGAGSMGTRRVRNLLELGYTDIIIYDIDSDSSIKTAAKHGVEYVRELSELWNNKPNMAIISIPPLTKQLYIDFCNQLNIPCFCEADICTYSGTYTASATMRFHPAIQKIKELLDNGTLGKIYTFTFHHGMHLRDWHPGADYKKYYAAKKETGAGQEMLCFELSWLSYLFGIPVDIRGFVDKKLNDAGISADDVFATTVKFGQSIISLRRFPFAINNTVYKNTITGTFLNDVVSRPAIRELRIIGEKCNLLWDWNTDYIELEQPDGEISMIFYSKGKAAESYNSNICEQMYVDELSAWIDSIQNGTPYPYSKEEEEAVIKMLKKVEEENG